jgi:DNA-binding winged helix-turn-helix (wHTH) protein
MVTSRSFPVRAFFGQFQINLATGEVQGRNGALLRVQQQPLQVLRLLLQAQGRVVSRDELRAALWSEETFVDFEHSVNTAVKKLRRALEASVENPKFIETVPKVGYRFLVPVNWIAELDAELPSHADLAIPLRQEVAPTVDGGKRLWVARSAVGMAVIAAGAIALVLLYQSPLLRSKAHEPSVSLAVTSVGEKYGPNLSADGKQLAFAWKGGTGSHSAYK